jgi:hypothetical protein
VSIVTEHTAEVRGDGVHRVLERLKVPAQFQYLPPSGGSKCWTVPARHARDVEAMAEHLGGTAEVDRQAVLL